MDLCVWGPHSLSFLTLIDPKESLYSTKSYSILILYKLFNRVIIDMRLNPQWYNRWCLFVDKR